MYDQDRVGEEELLGLLAERSRLEARVAVAVAELDRSGSWALDGAASVIQWLGTVAELAVDDARRLLTLGERLGALPPVESALREGVLTLGQVRSIVANLSDDTVALFREVEADMVAVLAPLTARQVSYAMQQWRAHARVVIDRGEFKAMPDRSLHCSRLPDGRWRIDADFDAEGGALVETAIARALSPDVDGEPRRNPAQRRADAFTDVCRFFLDHLSGDELPPRRPHLDVVVTIDALQRRLPGVLLDGSTLDAVSLRRLACDADIHRVITDASSAILDYGRRARVVPDIVRRALNVRDRHCRFPGCDRPATWCEAHHIEEWANGGETRLGNLVLLCTRHHHILHLDGWRHELCADNTFRVVTPTGRELLSRPPPSVVPSQSEFALIA